MGKRRDSGGDLQKDEGLEVGQGRRNGPRDVVAVQVQANETPEASKLCRNGALDVVFVELTKGSRGSE